MEFEESQKYKLNFIKEGRVLLSDSKYEEMETQESFMDLFGSGSYFSLNEILKLTEIRHKNTRMNSHNRFLKYRPKICLPEDDDMSNLSS